MTAWCRESCKIYTRERTRVETHSRDHSAIPVVNGATIAAVTGTNCHVVVEEATGVEVYHATPVEDGTALQLFVSHGVGGKSVSNNQKKPGRTT